MRADHVVTIEIDEGHAGVWPGMEPGSVRAAYDKASATSDVPQQVYSKDALLARGGGRRG